MSNILKTYNILVFSYHRERLEGLVRLPRDTIAEHRAIIDAINAKNPFRAEELMRSHLRKSSEQLMRERDEEGIGDPG